MFTAVIAVFAGLLLLADVLRSSSGPGQFIKLLIPFQTVIGVLALVVGLLNITSALGIVLILAGLVLAAHALTAVPRFGDELAAVGGTLSKFSILLGIIVLMIGFISLIRSLL